MNLTFVTKITLLTRKQVFPAHFRLLTFQPGLRLILANRAPVTSPLNNCHGKWRKTKNK
jgi:hypothetical protein